MSPLAAVSSGLLRSSSENTPGVRKIQAQFKFDFQPFMVNPVEVVLWGIYTPEVWKLSYGICSIISS